MKIFEVGYCTGPGKIATPSLPWKRVRFPARAFLVDVPHHGLILVDTGYSQDYFKAGTCFYDCLLPVTMGEPLAEQLKHKGIAPSDIAYLFITHYHPDHIAALSDFSKTPWIYRRDALNTLMRGGWFSSLRRGFFRKLIPPVPPGSIGFEAGDFCHSFLSTALKSAPLWDGIEVVDLPGHAMGQMGLFIQADSLLLIGDAAWSSEALQRGESPHFVGQWIQEDRKKYLHTFEELHRLTGQGVRCYPTHAIEEIC
ncbi:MAG: MBL fold metallo-hydrolase [Simkaniaceae bacterium]|nr:MBL fold metallo-hydrolase [Simkaniaceae bacterium]